MNNKMTTGITFPSHNLIPYKVQSLFTTSMLMPWYLLISSFDLQFSWGYRIIIPDLVQLSTIFVLPVAADDVFISTVWTHNTFRGLETNNFSADIWSVLHIIRFHMRCSTSVKICDLIWFIYIPYIQQGLQK
jgi:hypothetical protein